MAHQIALQRMIQAGVVPVTLQQVLFELYGATVEADPSSAKLWAALLCQWSATADCFAFSPCVAS